MILNRFLCTVALIVSVDATHAVQPAASGRAPSVVRIKNVADGHQLLRNGRPFFIRGAGGRYRLATLVKAGGNSIRTWDARNKGPLLDRAHELGLSVTVGIWLGHERHGFDYSDRAQVNREIDKARNAVLKYKDHPAVLMWGIGNEMEGDGSNPRIWQTVNDIAKMIKKIDPNHPTMTVIAGVWPDKIRSLNAYCPDIDVIGINCYGSMSAVPAAAKEQGLNRPYVITEFGPRGWWESPKTSWGAEIEPTSTEKADTYLTGYRAAVAQKTGWCLGAYAFLWGHKQEHTRTWFGMFLPSALSQLIIGVILPSCF